MKSHDFAKQLMLMAKILKSSPNVNIEDLSFSELNSFHNVPNNIEKSEVPKALSILVGLNEMNKSEWLDLIKTYEFDIEIRSRDATRDIIGKLLNYLANNPHERDKLTGKKLRKHGGSSSELADALSILLE